MPTVFLRRVLRAVLLALDRRALTIVAVAVVLELVVGIVVCASLGKSVRFYDETQYLAMGHHLADGGTLSIYGRWPTAWRTPGYPFLVAAVEWVGWGYPWSGG